MIPQPTLLCKVSLGDIWGYLVFYFSAIIFTPVNFCVGRVERERNP